MRLEPRLAPDVDRVHQRVGVRAHVAIARGQHREERAVPIVVAIAIARGVDRARPQPAAAPAPRASGSPPSTSADTARCDCPYQSPNWPAAHAVRSQAPPRRDRRRRPRRRPCRWSRPRRSPGSPLLSGRACTSRVSRYPIANACSAGALEQGARRGGDVERGHARADRSAGWPTPRTCPAWAAAAAADQCQPPCARPGRARRPRPARRASHPCPRAGRRRQRPGPGSRRDRPARPSAPAHERQPAHLDRQPPRRGAERRAQGPQVELVAEGAGRLEEVGAAVAEQARADGAARQVLDPHVLDRAAQGPARPVVVHAEHGAVAAEQVVGLVAAFGVAARRSATAPPW